MAEWIDLVMTTKIAGSSIVDANQQCHFNKN
jgi:hypothetical protein